MTEASPIAIVGFETMSAGELTIWTGPGAEVSIDDRRRADNSKNSGAKFGDVITYADYGDARINNAAAGARW